MQLISKTLNVRPRVLLSSMLLVLMLMIAPVATAGDLVSGVDENAVSKTMRSQFKKYQRDRLSTFQRIVADLKRDKASTTSMDKRLSGLRTLINKEIVKITGAINDEDSPFDKAALKKLQTYYAEESRQLGKVSSIVQRILNMHEQMLEGQEKIEAAEKAYKIRQAKYLGYGSNMMSAIRLFEKGMALNPEMSIQGLGQGLEAMDELLKSVKGKEALFELFHEVTTREKTEIHEMHERMDPKHYQRAVRSLVGERIAISGIHDASLYKTWEKKWEDALDPHVSDYQTKYRGFVALTQDVLTPIYKKYPGLKGVTIDDLIEEIEEEIEEFEEDLEELEEEEEEAKKKAEEEAENN